MIELTHVQALVLKRILSLKRPQTSKDIAKHFAISPATANHYIRALMVHGLVDVYKEVHNMRFYGRPRISGEPEESKEQPVKKVQVRVERTQYASKTDRNRNDSVILQDVWANVVKT